MAAGIGSAVAVLIIVAHIGLLTMLSGMAAAGPQASGTGSPVECNSLEQTAVHYHVALRMHLHGTEKVVPARTGIRLTCLYWIHVHDRSGILHIEAPATKGDSAFHLGDVFAVWRRPLDDSHVGPYTLKAGERVEVYVDGVKWEGNPADVPLVDHRTIDVVVSPASGFVYHPFEWPDGF